MQKADLIKDKWTKKDGLEFQKYLLSFSRDKKKCEWEKRVVNTNLKCIAVLSKDIKNISNEIAKGNFLSFLDLKLNETLSNSLINANLISKIKEFEVLKKYLTNFVESVDNWASIDTIAINVKGREEKFLDLANQYILSKKLFVRRMGIRILFKFLDDNHINIVFDMLSRLYDEKEYYVNMAIAWLVCEAFIKERNVTLKEFENKRFNDFVTNKAISKCRDSFRVSKADKEMLLKFKR